MTEARTSQKLTKALKFVSDQKRFGIVLMDLGGRATLHADPGITPDQEDRWGAMEEAVELLMPLRDELNYLVRRKIVKLPKHPGFS